MAIYINEPAYQGVPLIYQFTSSKTLPLRVFVRTSPVDLNNIRLLGVVRFLRRSNSLEPSQWYVVERWEIRFDRDSILFEAPLSIASGDLLGFIPLYDFPNVTINDVL